MPADAPVVTLGLYQVAQRVEDLDRAVRFYRDTLGLRYLGTWDPPGLALFDMGGVRLMLSGEGDNRAVIYLRVPEIQEAVDRLRAASVSVESEPHVIYRDETGQIHPAGTEEWMAFIRDSEGNLVGLASTVAPG